MQCHISDLVLDQIVPRVEVALEHGQGHDEEIGRLIDIARIPREGASQATVEEALNRWVGDVSAISMEDADRAFPAAAGRTCDPRLVAGMVGRSVSPYALRALSALCEGAVLTDTGSFEDGQMCLQPHPDGYDELMIPLTSGLYWCGGRLLIRDGTLPEAVMQSLTGRRANVITNLPELEGANIVAEGEPQGGFRSVLLDGGLRTEWARIRVRETT